MARCSARVWSSGLFGLTPYCVASRPSPETREAARAGSAGNARAPALAPTRETPKEVAKDVPKEVPKQVPNRLRRLTFIMRLARKVAFRRHLSRNPQS